MTEPSHENPVSLPFDVAERAAAVRVAMESILDPDTDSKILDIGGAPGRVARALEHHHPRWSVTVVDFPQCFDDRYVRASGLSLPFPNRSVDVTYCSDVLEHIPPRDRDRFLSELTRVARLGVVIAAPFRHPVVETAESLLDTFYREFLGSPHPWLREHIENGLPDLESTRAALVKASGDRDGHVAVLSNAELERWFILQLGELLSTLLPGARTPWTLFQQSLSSSWLQEQIQGNVCSYRKVLVSRYEAPPQFETGLSGRVDSRTATSSVASSQEVLSKRLEQLVDFARNLAKGWQILSRGDGAESGASDANHELIARLTAIVDDQEKRILSGDKSASTSKEGRGDSLRRWLGFGRKPDDRDS